MLFSIRAYLWLSISLLFANGSVLQGTEEHVVAKRQLNPGPFSNALGLDLLGYWPFIGTFYDVSPSFRGPALVNGTNVALKIEPANGFVQIRPPGFVSVPAIDLTTINFAIDFKLRVPALNFTTNQVVLANWQPNNWQYIMYVFPNGQLSLTLRRNIVTAGSDPNQDLVSVTTAAPVPIGAFFDASFVWDRTRRKLSVFIKNALSAEAVVRAGITDLTLHSATQPYVQLGLKADDFPQVGRTSIDVSQLRFWNITF